MGDRWTSINEQIRVRTSPVDADAHTLWVTDSVGVSAAVSVDSETIRAIAAQMGFSPAVDVSGWPTDHTPDAVQHDTDDGPAVCILGDGTVHLFGAVTFLAGKAAQDYLDEHLADDDSVCPHVSHCPHCYATDAVPLSSGLRCTNAWHHKR